MNRTASQISHAMRQLSTAALLVVAFLCSVNTYAATYTVENVPNVRLSDTRMHVSDPSALLSQQAKDTINALFTRLEEQTGIEATVVMLPSIGDNDVFTFAHQLFRHWGVGKKKSDNGLLILYVEDQHSIRFVTGYGLEGTLTDALCKRIQTRAMVPNFKRGDRDAGMVEGTRALCQVLDGTMKPDNDSNSDNDFGAIIFLLLIPFILLVLYITDVINVKRRCPACGKRALKTRSVDHYLLNGRRYRKEVAVCEHCGHVDVRNIDESHHDNYDGTSSLLTGMFIGSLFSGGRGGHGGGFSGGSFGGGNSGGGGAGSSW